MKSYCTNSQCSPLCMTSFLLPIYLVSYIFSSFYEYFIYINALSITFIKFLFILFRIFPCTRLWIIFSSLFVPQLYFLNCLFIWSLFGIFFILLVWVSICFHSYKLYIFIKASLPNNTKDALKEYCAINPLDYTILPWLDNRFSSFWQSRNTLHNLSMLPLHTQYDCTKQYIAQSYWASRSRLKLKSWLINWLIY